MASSPGIQGLNNYRFNGKEFQADLGLNWNHQDWRFFNPQIFTWSVVDPEVENGQESMSPYAFGYDNAVRYADVNGRAPGNPPITAAGIITSTFYGLAASVANTVLAAADYSSQGGLMRMFSGQSYRATAGADGISYAQRPAVTSDRQALGYIGADALDMASTAVTVATMGEGAAVGRGLTMSTGLLFEQGAGKVAQNAVVQEGKALASSAGRLKIDIAEENKIARDLLNPPSKPGNAPTFKKNGTAVEIHHEGQNPNGPFRELHRQDHRGVGNDKINHPNKSQPSQVERNEFARSRRDYWRSEYLP